MMLLRACVTLQQASPAESHALPVYELRSYQLILGYNPVPELRKAFCTGCAHACALPAASRASVGLTTSHIALLCSIPAKLSASAEGQLAFVAYSEVGCVVCSCLMQLLQLHADSMCCVLLLPLLSQSAEPGHGAVALQGCDGVHRPPRGVQGGAGVEGCNRQGGAHGAGAALGHCCTPLRQSLTGLPPVCRASPPPSCSPLSGARGSDLMRCPIGLLHDAILPRECTCSSI